MTRPRKSKDQGSSSDRPMQARRPHPKRAPFNSSVGKKKERSVKRQKWKDADFVQAMWLCAARMPVLDVGRSVRLAANDYFRRKAQRSAVRSIALAPQNDLSVWIDASRAGSTPEFLKIMLDTKRQVHSHTNRLRMRALHLENDCA